MMSLIAFVVLIGVLITAHEAGHFVVAKLSGVKVHTFSVGFGQAIFSKHIGETEYRIAWIPLGGYVRLHGMEQEFGDFEAQEGQRTSSEDALPKPKALRSEESGADPDAGRSLSDKPPWIRILIFAAGPVMNLILPFLLLPPFYFFVADFDQVYGSLMGSVDEGLPAYASGLRSGDQITTIDDQPVNTFWQVAQAVESYVPGGAPLHVRVQRPGLSQPIEVKIHPEQIAHTEPILGFTQVHNRIGFQPFPLAADVIIQNPRGIFAQSGGENFDRVVAMNGESLDRFYELTPRLSTLNPTQAITLTVERLTPIDSTWRFLHARQRVNLQLPPLQDWRQDWRQDWGQDRGSHTQRESITEGPSTLELINERLGVRQASACISSIDPHSAAAEVLKVGDCLIGVDGERHSLAAFLNQRIRHRPEHPKSLLILREGVELNRTLTLRKELHQDPLAGELSYWQVGFTFAGLSRAESMTPTDRVNNDHRWVFAWTKTKERVWGELSRSLKTLGGMFSGQVSPTQLSGPVTIFYLAGRQAEAGWEQFLYLMVILSLSIALINLVPVPGLDGGHILIALIEMITRRPLPPRVKMGLQVCGVLLILALVLFALGNDALRMWRLSQG